MTPATFGPNDPLPVHRRGITICEEAPPLPSLQLSLPDGRLVPLDRRLSIGSAPGNDIELSDPHVSGTHCVIFREAARLYIRDCGSSNGTYVGTVRVEAAELRPGIPLTVGKTALRIVAGPGQGIWTAEAAMIGTGAAMERLKRDLARVAGAAAAVLLLGESGAGKELAARAVHAGSGRTGRFVAVNCGALSSELAESELFGHERGAFTGAVTRKVGFFEEADGGTLFFDEIAELPLLLQPKLLRVLESRCVRLVGGVGEKPVNVRVVAATHQDLSAAVRKGTFRRDLYHRLSTVEIRLPSLRDRREDIPLLVEHFLAEVARDYGPRQISTGAMEALVNCAWPGNIRELRNALQHAAIFGQSSLIEPEDLPRSAVEGNPLEPSPAAREPAGEGSGPTPRPLSAIERDVVLEALRVHGSHRRAADAIGMPKSTFCDKVRRYRGAARAIDGDRSAQP